MLAKFEIYHDGEYWCARGTKDDIITQGETLDELVQNLKEAVELHFEDLLERGEEIAKGTLNVILTPMLSPPSLFLTSSA